MIKKLELYLLGLIAAMLAILTIGAIAGWQFTDVFAISFFSFWGILFLYYAIVTRSYYSLIILGLMAGAAGLLLGLLQKPGAEPAVLLGKISLGIFTGLLGYHLFKIRNEIQDNQFIYLGLLLVLVVQLVAHDYRTFEAVSLKGFANYAGLGVIMHVLLNDYLSLPLTQAEKRVLILQAVFCLYNICWMLIGTFV